MLIVTVLKQSNEYQAQHARWLHRQLKDYDSLCLTDCHKIEGVNTARLLYDLPAWWSKLEVFNPEHYILGKKDLLLLDIDSVIVGDLTPLLAQEEFTTLTDFYYETDPVKPVGSAVMFIPYEVKEYIWRTFISSPHKWMNARKSPPEHGDQGFLSSLVSPKRWQEILPGKVISYKKDVACKGMPGWHSGRSLGDGTVPADARVICFHGYPRPWVLQSDWLPPL